jgi:putative flavoprotein involved in K+ transport
MSNTISKELIIIGAGPSGLKAGQLAAENKIDYVILEKGETGQSWREVKPDMHFLSPCLPQRDWTSLSSKFPIWKLPVRRPYCTAAEFANYMIEFSHHFKLDIKENLAVTDIQRNGGQYKVKDQEGNEYSAPALIVATGIFGNKYIPEIPGVENNPIALHSHDYMRASDFKNKKVLIVGAGNSAAETAIDLVGDAMVYMVSRNDLQYFADTRKLYHIRGISESYLKELIAMEIIRYRAFQEIEKIEDNIVYFQNWDLKVDHIIFATGYRGDLSVVNDFDIKVNKYNYPEISYAGESLQYPNLFFTGPLAFQKMVSIVIHGFIKQIPDTMARVMENLRNGHPAA